MTPPITATMVAQILGISPWGGPWKAWARLMGLSESSGNAATKRGNLLENAVADEYAFHQDCSLTRGPAFGAPPIVRRDRPWMACHPDRFAQLRTEDAEKWLLEVKTARTLGDEWGPAGTGEIPAHYAAQCMWQMAVCEVDRCDLVVYCTMSDEMRTYTLRRDLAVEGRLIEILRAWHERHVIGGEPPPIDGTADCSRGLAHIHPGGVDRVWIDGIDSDRDAVAEMEALTEQRIALGDRIAEIQHRLQSRIGDAYGIRDVARWSPVKGRQTIDAEGLRKAHPEIAAQFTRIGQPGRRFTLLDPKESE